MPKHPETEVLHRGEGAREGATPLTTPIYATSTFVFANAAELEVYQEGRSVKYIYSRYANPTVQAVEEKLAVLEGAEAALVTSSGMAATTTALFGLLASGEEVVCSAAIYGGTLHLIADFLKRFGVAARFASLDQLAAPESIIGPATKVLWFESPINPTLRCVDIRKIAEACRARNVMSVIDNTFASPVNQQPIGDGRGSGDALGDEIPERSQRRHRGRAHRIAGGHRPAGSRPEAVRRRPRAGVRVCAVARAQDADAPHGASQHERDGGRLLARRMTRGSAVSSIPACRRTPTTRSPNVR